MKADAYKSANNLTVVGLAKRSHAMKRQSAIFVAAFAAAACGKGTITAPADKNPEVSLGAGHSIPGHEDLAQDTTVKEGPRVLPAETYMRIVPAALRRARAARRADRAPRQQRPVR